MYVTLTLSYLNNNTSVNIIFNINIKGDLLRNIIVVSYNVV
ncbi:MAG: Unknown protein [uncultured Sulfurovum sp.]|uniref:Uncharacterized protein n=1 Tax=uncultured Sulfurovum sp. TaxID=269237 RepID=A0A6S6TBW2_9BACT|nr:MAG: Unknown protein [uncultured Sulfurovum sp.]